MNNVLFSNGNFHYRSPWAPVRVGRKEYDLIQVYQSVFDVQRILLYDPETDYFFFKTFERLIE